MENPKHCANKLIDLLKSTRKHKITAKKFEKIRDGHHKILFLEDLLNETGLNPDLNGYNMKKNLDLSNFHRVAGNDSYKKKNFMDSLERYNKRFVFWI